MGIHDSADVPTMLHWGDRLTVPSRPPLWWTVPGPEYYMYNPGPHYYWSGNDFSAGAIAGSIVAGLVIIGLVIFCCIKNCGSAKAATVEPK